MYCSLMLTNQWLLAFNYFQSLNKSHIFDCSSGILTFHCVTQLITGLQNFASASINNRQNIAFIWKIWPLSLINDFIMIWGFGDDNADYSTASSTSSFSSLVLIKVSVFTSHFMSRESRKQRCYSLGLMYATGILLFVVFMCCFGYDFVIYYTCSSLDATRLTASWGLFKHFINACSLLVLGFTRLI